MATMSNSEELEAQLAWLRYVESMHEDIARRQLRARLRSDAAHARGTLQLLEPWSSMPPGARQMFTRDGEVVRLRRLVDLVPVGARILDIGCGPGVVAGTLALHGRPSSYLGIDLNGPKVASAREMATINHLDPLLRFEVGDAAELPADIITSLAPDTVLILEVLEHLLDPVAVLTSIADLIPDTAQIVFSVPILGRIEACWGHRTLYGASAILGLAAACRLRVLDVQEVHNTWAIATVTRSDTPVVATADTPITISHVVASNIEVNGVESSTSTQPSRLHLALAPGQTATVEATTPDADWLRVDIENTSACPLARMEVLTLDAGGEVIRRWVPPLGRLVESGRRTIIVRPQEAERQRTSSMTRTERTRLILDGDPTSGVDLTIWRVGFAAGYEALLPPSDQPDPTAHDTESPIPWLTSDSTLPDATAVRSSGSLDRVAESGANAARSVVTRWPRLRRPAVRVRDGIKDLRRSRDR